MTTRTDAPAWRKGTVALAILLVAGTGIAGCSKPSANATCKDWVKYNHDDRLTAATALIQQHNGSASLLNADMTIGSIDLYCRAASSSDAIANVYNGNALTGNN